MEIIIALQLTSFLLWNTELEKNLQRWRNTKESKEIKRCVHNISMPEAFTCQINSYIMYKLSAQQELAITVSWCLNFKPVEG